MTVRDVCDSMKEKSEKEFSGDCSLWNATRQEWMRMDKPFTAYTIKAKVSASFDTICAFTLTTNLLLFTHFDQNHKRRGVLHISAVSM